MKFISLNQLPLYTDDFFITHFENITNKDAIVIHNPPDALITSPVFIRSRKTLIEHIEYIQSNNIRKAYIVASDISFLPQCPSLEYVKIFPAMNTLSFDYSPLYQMPNLKSVECLTATGPEDHVIATIDYSKIHGIKYLGVSGAGGHLNVDKAGDVHSLYFDFGFPAAVNLRNTIPGGALRSLSISQSPIRTLEGIEDACSLRRLELSYNRRLVDISALHGLRTSLRFIEIDTCSKIVDFSVLSELYNLEFLILKGSNMLRDLSFLKAMPNLRYLHLTMNVQNGELCLCNHIPYVKIQNRKHYSHKDKDLPKSYINPDAVYPFSEE